MKGDIFDQFTSIRPSINKLRFSSVILHVLNYAIYPSSSLYFITSSWKKEQFPPIQTKECVNRKGSHNDRFIPRFRPTNRVWQSNALYKDMVHYHPPSWLQVDKTDTVSGSMRFVLCLFILLSAVASFGQITPEAPKGKVRNSVGMKIQHRWDSYSNSKLSK